MSSWLRSQWLAFQHSFDREEVLAGSHPKTTAVAVVGMWLVFGIIGYVPRLAEASQFVRPWIPILLSTIGGVFTLTVWREGARGPLALLATLLDNAFYSAAFVVAACSTQGGYAIGLAVTQGLVLIAFVAPTYALTLPFTTVMTIPPLLAFAVWMPSAAVSVILLCSWVMMLVGSVWASRRRELLAAQKKLTAAVTAANQIADESVQAALATTLLSLGNFLHELRNHQTSIRANLSYVAMQANLDAEARAALDDALESQEAEEQLTRDTIASLKEKAGPEAESFLIDEVIERVRSSAAIESDFEAAASSFRVKGSVDHLEGVLTNMVRNAEQAGATHMRFSSRLEPSGHALCLTVEDDGPGIPEEHWPKLFQPFGITTKATGTGLGLYLCRRYVELFGGTIAVGRASLGGASFDITLPGRTEKTGA